MYYTTLNQIYWISWYIRDIVMFFSFIFLLNFMLFCVLYMIGNNYCNGTLILHLLLETGTAVYVSKIC